MSSFNKWRSDFLISINSDDFKKPFEQCISYIEQIAYFNKLCEPYSKETDSFLNDTVKPAIDTILKYEIEQGNRQKLGDITYFLKAITVLIPIAFMNNKFNLFKILNQITDPEMELYKSIKKTCGKCENLTEIQKYIVQHEYLTVMMMKLQKDENVHISHFTFFFQTYNKLVDYLNDQTETYLFALREPYQIFLDILISKDIKTIESNNLEELFSNFCKLASTTDPDMFSSSINTMTILAVNFFLSPDFENQKLGASPLKIFTDTKQKHEQEFINKAFLNTLNKLQLIPKILTHNTQSDTYTIISPLIEQISSNNYIKAADLSLMYKNMINSNESELKSRLKQIVDIIKELKTPEAETFFEEVSVFTDNINNIQNSNDESPFTQNLKTFTALIVNFFTEKPSSPSILTQKIFNKLFDSAEGYIKLTSKQPDDALEDLSQIYSGKKNISKDNNFNFSSVRRELIKVLHSRFSEKYTGFIARLLTEIANCAKSSFKDDFDVQDIRIITRYIIELNNDDKIMNGDDFQYSLYPLYTILINKFNEKINTSVVKAMLRSPSDASWDFLRQIIENSQFNNFDEDAIQSLTEFVLNNYNQNGILYYDFLELFIININIKAGTIEEIDDMSSIDELEINKTPLLYEDILEKIILETEDSKTLELVMKICFNFYENYPDKNEVLRKMLDLYKKHVDDNKKGENIIRKMNIVTFLFEYCKKINKGAKARTISHKSSFSRCSDDLSSGDTRVEFRLGEEIVKFKVKNLTPHLLYQLISPYLDSSINNFYIQRYRKNPISLKDTLSLIRGRPNIFVVKNVNEKDEEKVASGDNDDDSDDSDSDDDSRASPKKKYDYEIKGGGFFKGYEPMALEFFVQNGITKSLFGYMSHFDSPKDVVSENQLKFDKLIFDFLMFLPTDPELFELSASKDKFFLPEISAYDFQSFVNNKYALKYLFQALLIRFQCPKYVSEYKETVTRILTQIVKNDDESLTLCLFMLTEMLMFIEKLQLNTEEFVILLIQLLSLSNISDNSDTSKLEVIDVLKDNISEKSNCIIDISKLLCQHIDLFDRVLSSISNKIWEEFRTIIYSFENPKELFRTILGKLLSCQEEEIISQINRYYTDIFTKFIIGFSKTMNNPEDVNNYIRVIMKIIKFNPTKKLTSSLIEIAKNNSDLLSTQDNDCSLTSIIDGLINIVRLDSKPSMMECIIDALIELASLNDKNKKQLIEFAEQIASYVIEKWNQSSEADTEETKTDDDQNSVISHKEKGLRNLSQTCYLNSALQQFYHIPAFRYFLSTYAQNHEGKDDDDDVLIAQTLGYVFNKMEFSRKSSINPKRFVFIFANKHEAFQPGQQQDAQEFISYFLDDFKGRLHDLFEWKIATKYYKLEDNQEISSNVESYPTIPLSVETRSMQDSLREYFSPQKLTGENLYQLSDGTKMESILVQKIEKAPPVLIFQLKRFNFNISTSERVKISKRFPFANKISLKKYMVNSNENDSYDYLLNGVVVHTGNGQFGHYISLVKENINSNNWLLYDDSRVKRIETMNEFEEITFGNDDPQKSFEVGTAYILFYIRENAKVDVKVDGESTENKFILDQSIPIQISTDDRMKINKDNAQFLFNQCVLEKSTFTFMMQCSENTQLFRYFFGVFCHTKMYDKIKEIQDQLTSTCKDQNVLLSYLDLMNDEKQLKSLILPVFTGISNEKMSDSAFALVNTIIVSSENKEKAGQCVQKIIQNLSTFNKKWNRVNMIGTIIVNYLNKDGFIFASENNWGKLLLMYVFDVYEKTNYIQSIDISTIFKSLSLIVSKESTFTKENSDLYTKLPSIAKKVKDSNTDANKISYKELIINCIIKKLIKTSDVSKDFDRINVVLSYQLKKAKETPDSFPILFDNLIKDQGYSASEIINEISSSTDLIKSLLKSNLPLIVHILIFEPPLDPRKDMNSADKIVDMIIPKKSIYYGASPSPSKLDLNEEEQQIIFTSMKDIIPIIDSAYPPFFSLLNWLIQQLRIPSDAKIEGLSELISKSSSIHNERKEEMLEIENFFHPEKLVASVTEMLQNAITKFNQNDPVHEKILTSFEKSENRPVLFAQIASLPQWKSYIPRMISKSSYLERLASFVVKMQRQTDKITNDDEKISYIDSISNLLSLVIQVPDNNNNNKLAKYVPNVASIIDIVFDKAKDVIKRSKEEEEKKKESLLIPPDFHVILDFASYMKVIEEILKNEKRNSEKDAAMQNYSEYVLKLIKKSESFASGITEEDSEELKRVRDFISSSLRSSISIDPTFIFRPNLQREHDKFIMNLVEFVNVVCIYNGEFRRQIMTLLAKNDQNTDDLRQIKQILLLKFNIESFAKMKTEECVKEVCQISSRVPDKKSLFFVILSDFFGRCENEELMKALVKTLFIESSTQMTENSFRSFVVRGNEIGGDIVEKNFYEGFLKEFSHEERLCVLKEVAAKYEKVLMNPEKKDLFQLNEALTKMMVLVSVDRELKPEIVKLIQNNGEGYHDRAKTIVSMILKC